MPVSKNVSVLLINLKVFEVWAKAEGMVIYIESGLKSATIDIMVYVISILVIIY